MRGTKRTCPACAVRFYDLSRDPIVCPSCGAQHVPDAPALLAAARAAGFASKTDWRSRRFKRPDPEPDVAPEIATAGDAPEATPVPNDEVVLDEGPDGADISGLLGHREAEPGDR